MADRKWERLVWFSLDGMVAATRESKVPEGARLVCQCDLCRKCRARRMELLLNRTGKHDACVSESMKVAMTNYCQMKEKS